VGADARVLQAGIRADDIRQTAFPTGNAVHLASSGSVALGRPCEHACDGGFAVAYRCGGSTGWPAPTCTGWCFQPGIGTPAPCFPLNCGACVRAASTWNGASVGSFKVTVNAMDQVADNSD